jgi:hypothetical protein
MTGPFGTGEPVPPQSAGEDLLFLRVEVSGLAQTIADHLAAQLAAAAAPPSPWLDLQDAAAHLSCSPERLRKLVQRRAIPFHQERSGGRIFFHRREIDKWLLEQ